MGNTNQCLTEDHTQVLNYFIFVTGCKLTALNVLGRN